MHIKILGSAAGGGFPQWNCNCPGCRRARAGDVAARPRTQAGLAVSEDGRRWVLLNASPDLPAQIRATPALQPDFGDPLRSTPIAAVIISSGDVDCIAGLLSLREGQALVLYADEFVRKILEGNEVFRVLDRRVVRFETLATDVETAIMGADGAPLGLSVMAFHVPGKIPLYQEGLREGLGDPAGFAAADAVTGLCLSDGGKRVFYIPGCGAVTEALRARIGPGDVLFFDGTLWRDDEMLNSGTGAKTGARMGHISLSGPAGSLAAFEGTPAARKIFIHINNTNPILCEDSAEAAQVRAAGWEIAHDGMEVTP